MSVKTSSDRPEYRQLDLAKLTNHFVAKINDLAIKSGRPGWVFDDENRQTVESLLLYFAHDPSFLKLKHIHKPSFKKGIALLGNVGSGKSLILDAFAQCQLPGNQFFTVKARKIVSEFDQFGTKGIKRFGSDCYRQERDNDPILSHANIDDLGTEDFGAFYGKRTNVLAGIFLDRYDRWVKYGVKTHFSANLTPAQIKQDYTNRVASRIEEMCNVLYLGAKAESTDRRKL